LPRGRVCPAVQSDSTSLAHEAELFAALLETKDAKEGINAFLEKRQPNFQDE